jgi:hypothetical protein
VRLPWWCKYEKYILAAHYGRVPADELARWLGRPVGQVHQAAGRLGLSVRRVPVNRRQRATVRRMALTGSCNACIGRAIGRGRRTVELQRLHLGVPASGTRHTCGCKRRAVEAQRRTLGIRSAGELRAKVLGDRVRASGWPECLRWRETKILDALMRHGPMSRKEIAAAIGYPWPRNQKKALMGSVPGGSYLGHLMQLGLIVTLPGRPATVTGHGKGRSGFVYTLTFQALDQRKVVV